MKAKVNNEKGIIVLPDNWSSSYYALNNTASYNENSISLSSWNTLEECGAVFLPAAGEIFTTDPLYILWEYSIDYGQGIYWSSSVVDGSVKSKEFWDESSYTLSGGRGHRHSVRLVQDY